MQILDVGICVDNIDPKGIGRVRYRPYSIPLSDIVGNREYVKWGEDDPLIAIPFLPLHINITPQIDQSIKIIRYDSDKTTQNIEYIAGPFTSPHDIQNQSFTSQHKYTTYGTQIVKDVKDIRSTDGVFNSPDSNGAVIKEKDTGFRGNYGSDIIFTENGIQVRGGMLKVKQGKNKQKILDYPHLAKKMGRFSMKKFPTTLKSVKETTTTSVESVSKIKYIIEYEIDDLTAPTELRLFVYQVLGKPDVEFDTNVFGDDTVFDTSDTEIVKLINTGNTSTDATYIQPLNGTIQSGYIELRELLHLIDMEGITSLHFTYPNGNSQPFYYRPTSDFKLTNGINQTESDNKITFLSQVQVRNKVTSSGLIYSRQSANPPVTVKEKIISTTKELKNRGEQSFSNLSADKVYITSTDPNIGVNVKQIDFNNLDPYELTQDDYINKIEPNTYAMVRGENLFNLLVAMKNLFDSHIHNINDVLVKSDPKWVKLNELIESMRNDLLNDSLRIN